MSTSNLICSLIATAYLEFTKESTTILSVLEIPSLLKVVLYHKS